MKNSRSLTISDFCFLKYFTEKAWQMGEKKFTEKNLSVRVRKNSGNFISNDPILLSFG